MDEEGEVTKVKMEDVITEVTEDTSKEKKGFSDNF